MSKGQQKLCPPTQRIPVDLSNLITHIPAGFEGPKHLRVKDS